MYKNENVDFTKTRSTTIRTIGRPFSIYTKVFHIFWCLNIKFTLGLFFRKDQLIPN